MGRGDSWSAMIPGVVPSLRYTKNSRTVLPVAHLMADYESGSLDSYSSFLVTIRLSRFLSDIFACDRQTMQTMGPIFRTS